MSNIKDFELKDYDTLVKELQAKNSITDRLEYWYNEVYKKVNNHPDVVNLSGITKSIATYKLLTPILKYKNEPAKGNLDIPESIWYKFFDPHWDSPERNTWYYEKFQAGMYFEIYKKRFLKDYNLAEEGDRINKLSKELKKLKLQKSVHEKKELHRLKYEKSSFIENSHTDFTAQVIGKYILFKKYLLEKLKYLGESQQTSQIDLNLINNEYDTLKKLSDSEIKHLKKETYLNQEATSLFIYFLQKVRAIGSPNIGNISNDKVGVLFHHLTGYSANTLGDSLSEIEVIITKDGENKNEWEKLKAIQTLLENIASEIDIEINKRTLKNTKQK